MSNSVHVLHGETAEGGFGITAEIIGSEVVHKLLYKGWVVVKPCWDFVQFAHDDGFKPIESSTFKIRNSVAHHFLILMEGVWTVREDKVASYKELA